HRFGDAEFRLSVAAGGALENLRCGCYGAAPDGVCEGVSGIGVEEPHRIRKGPPRLQCGVLELVELIIHRRSSRSRSGGQRQDGFHALHTSAVLLRCNRGGRRFQTRASKGRPRVLAEGAADVRDQPSKPSTRTTSASATS